MKHIAIGLDYDGCIFNPSYVSRFSTKERLQNHSIIDMNVELWKFILNLCNNNPDLELLTFVHFSGRQCLYDDLENSRIHQSESFFLAMKKIKEYFSEMPVMKKLSIRIELNCLLMPDIYHKKDSGDTHQKALDSIVNCLNSSSSINHDDYYHDETKVSFIFAHVHEILAEEFYYFDDRLDILNIINEFYGNEIGRNFIPQNTKVILVHYNGKLISFLSEIIGTGNPRPYYAEVLRRISEYEVTTSVKVLPNINDKNCTERILNFKLMLGEK